MAAAENGVAELPRLIVPRRRAVEEISAGGDSLTLGGGGGGGDADQLIEPPSVRREIGAHDDAASHIMQPAGDMVMSSSGRVAESSEPQPNEVVRFFLRMVFNSVLHPYEYAKVLMQLGHEPLPATVSRNWLGRPTMVLPNVHKYVQFIRRTDGLTGLYRGLGARVIGCVCSAIFSDSLIRFMGWHQYRRSAVEPPHQFKEYLWNLLRNSITVATAALVSHPFYVVSVRQMAQFVGHEITYNSLRGSFREIITQEGFAGLFAGFVPRLLYDLSVLFLASTASNIFNRTCVLNPVQQQYNAVVLQFAAAMIMYPLQVCASCMASTGARLAACGPPYMPIYSQWTDCLSDLYTRGDHTRGAVLFWRPLPKIQMRFSEGLVGPVSKLL